MAIAKVETTINLVEIEDVIDLLETVDNGATIEVHEDHCNTMTLTGTDRPISRDKMLLWLRTLKAELQPVVTSEGD